jgi:glycosyltransferase involved in cell wall biosynthesis
MMNHPFVSVLLPVYHGEKYIHEAITSIINQLDQDFELIISIDSSLDSSESIARKFESSDVRVKVYTHNKRLGMRGNYKFLIEKAKGSWITILGQDDAMMPFAVSELRKSVEKTKKMSALVSTRAYAFWPDTNGDFGRHQFIYPIRENKVKEVSSIDFLVNCLKGKSEYSQGPQLYTGSFISRKLVDQLLSSQNGDLFPYPIPDVSSSASILLTCENFHFSNLPLFIVGTSGGSTGVLIDKSLKSNDTPATIQKLYADSFNGLSEKFDTPGLGVFSSFSWYMFEAINKVASTDQLLRLNFDPVWALAALRTENRGAIKNNPELGDIFLRLHNEFRSTGLSLQRKIAVIRLFKARNLIWKYIYGFALLIQRRLILEPLYKQFNMNEFIVSTTSRIK